MLLSNYIKNNIFISFVYILLWTSYFWLPSDIFVFDNASMLFIPAGIRVAAYLVLPRKYWLTVLFTEIIIVLTLIQPTYQYVFTHFILTFVASALPLGCVYLYKQYRQNWTIFDLSSMIALTVLLFTTAILSGINLSLGFSFEEYYESNSVLSNINIVTLQQFAAGDLLGMLIVVPISLYINSMLISKKRIDIKKHVLIACIVSSVFAILYALLYFIPLYYIRLFTVIIMVILAFKFGLFAAIISVLWMSVIISMTYIVYPQSSNNYENQILFLSIAFITLGIGALIDKYQQLMRQMVAKNKSLAISNTELNRVINKNRSLLMHMSTIQEQERQRLSTDLHDEVGQNVTAISLELSIMTKLNPTDLIHDSIQRIKMILERINNTTHRLISTLHPRAIKDLGLIPAIESSEFMSLLQHASIDCNFEYNGDFSLLNEEQNINIYRILQETVSNTVKYAQASEFIIQLQCDDTSVTLLIMDNGKGIIQTNKDGFGLLGIKERVLFLQGTHQMFSDDKGTRHIIALPIAPASKCNV